MPLGSMPRSASTPSDDSWVTPSDATPSDESSDLGDGFTAEPSAVNPEPVQQRHPRLRLRTAEQILEDPTTVPFVKFWAQRRPSWNNETLNQKLYEILLACPPGSGTKQLDWYLGTERVTLQTFCSVLGVSRCRVHRLLDAMREGRAAPFEDNRSQRINKHPQQEHADVWFNWCWHTLATPIPTAKVSDYTDAGPPSPASVQEPEGPDSDSELAAESRASSHAPASAVVQAASAVPFESVNEWALSSCPSNSAVAPLHSARGLLKMNFNSFYDLYTTTTDGQPVSYATFRRAWVQGSWSGKLKFLPVGHHSSCSACAHFREWRRHCVTDGDRAKLEEARSVHIKRIMLDRAVCSRMDDIARKSMQQRFQDMPQESRHGAMTIDGMDQAKFKVPRWKFAKVSKDLEGLWRPTLHVHGTIVHGSCETFFLCEPDLPKDANLQITCMARALQLAAVSSAKLGIPMPPNWRFDFDNTPAEGKHATCFTWYSWLIAEGRFTVIDAQSMEVGHTHNIQDQRFATAATILAEAARLESPHAFQKCLKAGIQPLGDCVEEIVEIMEASLDWKTWLASLAVNWQGHTSSQYTKLRGEECVHCFRFLKRSHLQAQQATSAMSEFPEPPSPDDVVVLLKKNISDKTYCGVPVVCLPAGRAKLLCGSGPKMVQRHRLSDHELQKMLKTAQVIEQRPWAMTVAADYLRSFVENNRTGAKRTNAPDIKWCWDPSFTEKLCVPEDAIGEDLNATNNKVPQKVRVSAKGAAGGRVPGKRIAGKQRDPTVAEPAAAGVADDRAAVASGGGGRHQAVVAPDGGGQHRAALAPNLEVADLDAEASGHEGAPAPRRKQRKTLTLSNLPAVPEGHILGCSKCRMSPVGCRRCRAKAHIVEAADGSWVHRPPT